jgi:hypothetical protein
MDLTKRKWKTQNEGAGCPDGHVSRCGPLGKGTKRVDRSLFFFSSKFKCAVVHPCPFRIGREEFTHGKKRRH